MPVCHWIFNGGTRPGETVAPLQFFVEIGVCRATLHDYCFTLDLPKD